MKLSKISGVLFLGGLLALSSCMVPKGSEERTIDGLIIKDTKTTYAVGDVYKDSPTLKVYCSYTTGEDTLLPFDATGVSGYTLLGLDALNNQLDGTAPFANANIGQVSFKATYKNFESNSLTINVASNVINVSGVNISDSSVNLNIEGTKQLSATVLPNNATDKSVTWSSLDNNIAIVSSSGLVRAVAEGSTTIKVTTNDGGFEKTCTVNVSPVSVTSISVLPTNASMAIGENRQFIATVLPTNATNKNVTWSSSNNAVATVSTSGLVSGLSVGNATITATSEDGNKVASAQVSVSDVVLDKWTIMIYMCGSDLESDANYRLATEDLSEIASVSGQPNDINIIIEAGGAASWASTYSGVINKNYLNRFHLQNGTYVKDAQIAKANMGLSSTFQSFMEWGLTSYPASKTAVIFWNHGGAIDGVCYDENYGNDSLTDDEVITGLRNAFATTSTTGKLEWVGYDACLMAVQDVASLNADYFNYMIASEESESGYGWDYDTWLDNLYINQSTTEVLTAIVDGFIDDNGGTSSTRNDQTLSFYDLNKMDNYVDAWEDMALHLNNNVITNSTKWNTFVSLLETTQRYGYDEDYGYTFDVFDIGDFINKMQASSTYSSDSTLQDYLAVLESAYNELIIYESHGRAAGNSTGLCLFCITNPYYRTANDYTNAMTKLTNWRALVIRYL